MSAKDGEAQLFCLAMQSPEPMPIVPVALTIDGRRKIAGRRHCRAGPLAAKSPSQEGRGRGALRRIGKRRSPTWDSLAPICVTVPSGGGLHEAGDILWLDLDSERGPHRF